MSATLVTTTPERRSLPSLVYLLAFGVAAALTRILVLPAEGWSGLLTAAVFGIHLAVGAMVFLAIQAVTGARWWAPLRAVPLALARTLAVPAAALVVCLVFGSTALYPWARPGEVGPLVAAKAAWLNEPFFYARALVVLTVWFGFVGAFERRVALLDAEASAAHQQALVRTSVAFLLVFAVTISVASWDWTMSLEPEWFSTLYGVYCFAGAFLGGIAAVTALAVGPWSARLLRRPLTDAQRHDLGKLLFAFATFWAYIWFCQYLLIWYSNLPEETGHYVARLSRGWTFFFYLNSVLNFVVPFVALLSIRAKRHEGTLLHVAFVVLLGRWLDTYLLVAPALGPAPGLPVAAVAATIGIMAAMALIVYRISGEGGRS